MVQIGQNTLLQKNRTGSIKKRIGPNSLRKNCCAGGQTTFDFLEGPKQFLKDAQQDFIDSHLVQIGPNTILKKIEEEGIKFCLAQKNLEWAGC